MKYETIWTIGDALDVGLKAAALVLLAAVASELTQTNKALTEIASRPTTEHSGTVIKNVRISATGPLDTGIMLQQNPDTLSFAAATPEWAQLKDEVHYYPEREVLREYGTGAFVVPHCKHCVMRRGDTAPKEVP